MVKNGLIVNKTMRKRVGNRECLFSIEITPFYIDKYNLENFNLQI